MTRLTHQKILTMAALFLGVWLGIRYLLPVVLPFLLGAGLALLADPLVRILQNRLRFPRLGAVALGVGLLLTAVLGLLTLLGAAAYRELGSLAWQLPGVLERIRAGWRAFTDWLLTLADRSPAAFGDLLTDWVERASSGGASLLEQFSGRLLGLAGSMLGILPDGLLFLGTAILSAFMISAKLPRLRILLRKSTLPGREKLVSLVRGLRQALGGWLRAE